MHYFISLMLLLFFDVQDSGDNQISGTVQIPEYSESVKLGDGYKNRDGTKVMHSDDPMASPGRNVIVSAHPLDFEPELEAVSNAYINQQKQTFIPLVLPVTIGSTVYFKNEDQFFHNVLSMTKQNRFNIGRRPPNNTYPQTIKKKGVIDLSCDIHTHMSGVILSLDTPYFTRVDEKGNYTLKGLPDGRYRLEVFHIKLEKLVRQVEVKDGSAITVNFNFKRP